VWSNARAARAGVDYSGRTVLDLASWDGMWAFEAEALGAALTVATDCMFPWHAATHHGMRNLLLIREAMFSEVIHFGNVAAGRLRTSLAPLLHSHPQLAGGFDVVQHLGLLYHLRDPMLSLAEARSVLKDGGTLLLETACVPGEGHALVFNANRSLYDDITTWWLPTLPCLHDMLRSSLFEVEDGSASVLIQSPSTLRVALRATARPPRDGAEERYLVDPTFGFGFGEALSAKARPGGPGTVLGF
jgi:tRNA (mo5U34)-methyltransferase